MPTLKKVLADIGWQDRNIKRWSDLTGEVRVVDQARASAENELHQLKAAGAAAPVPATWPPGVNVEVVERAGRTPEDFPIHRYPVTDVLVFVPTQAWREKYDFWYGDLITEARVPADTPQATMYLPGGNEREGWQTREITEGFCMDGIDMELRDAEGVVLQSEMRHHREGVVRALNMDPNQPLWQRLSPGGPPLEGVRAYVRTSFMYLIDNGVQAHYFPAGNGYLKGEWAQSAPCSIALSEDGQHVELRRE